VAISSSVSPFSASLLLSLVTAWRKDSAIFSEIEIEREYNNQSFPHDLSKQRVLDFPRVLIQLTSQYLLDQMAAFY
jgi:hypothetical protein